jgi:hypothetical protein
VSSRARAESLQFYQSYPALSGDYEKRVEQIGGGEFDMALGARRRDRDLIFVRVLVAKSGLQTFAERPKPDTRCGTATMNAPSK